MDGKAVYLSVQGSGVNVRFLLFTVVVADSVRFASLFPRRIRSRLAANVAVPKLENTPLSTQCHLVKPDAAGHGICYGPILN